MKNGTLPHLQELREILFSFLLIAALILNFFSILNLSNNHMYLPLFFSVAVQSFLMIQAVLLFHDCLHNSAFTKTPIANQFAGRIIGGMCLWPYTFIRESHLAHHRNAGKVTGDTEVLHFTQEEAERRTAGVWMAKIAHTKLGPFLFTLILQWSQFAEWLVKIYQNQDAAKSKALIVDLFWMLLIWLPTSIFLFSNSSFLQGSLLGYLIPGIFGMAGVYFVSKPLHTQMMAEPMPKASHLRRVFNVSRTFDSTPLVRILFCNLNYHIEHHLHPGISRWNLGVFSRNFRTELLQKSRSEQIPIAIHQGYFNWYKQFQKQRTLFNQIRTEEALRLSLHTFDSQ